MITIQNDAGPDTMHAITVYQIDAEFYYFVDGFFGGAWIAGSVSNGDTITAAALTPRVIVAFSTTQ